MLYLLINDKKKDQGKVAENLSLHQVGKEAPISFLKDAHFVANSMQLKLSQPLRLR
jgi:hypothetical protein